MNWWLPPQRLKQRILCRWAPYRLTARLQPGSRPKGVFTCLTATTWLSSRGNVTWNKRQDKINAFLLYSKGLHVQGRVAAVVHKAFPSRSHLHPSAPLHSNALESDHLAFRSGVFIERSPGGNCIYCLLRCRSVPFGCMGRSVLISLRIVFNFHRSHAPGFESWARAQ